MECALYCPVYGFYEKEEDTVGRGGHFYTSVSVGSLFGELLARQFAEWLDELQGVPEVSLAAGRQGAKLAQADKSVAPLQVVEAGAHDGRLARDILGWFRAQRPDLLNGLIYWVIEPSERRQEWQLRTLKEFLPQVRWATNLADLAESSDRLSGPTGGQVRGVIFSNELLDSMPAHRLGWDAARQAWFEWGVTLSEGRLEWTRLEWKPASEADPDGWVGAIAAAPEWSSDLLKALPEGFTIEIGVAAATWWNKAAGVLGAGKLLGFDYGITEEGLVQRGGTAGTLRAYYRHQAVSDVLDRPGEQDITAHVNFSALCRVGENGGLKAEGLFSQEQFLTRIAAPTFNRKGGSDYWTAQRIRQFKTLTHPDHLGRSFKVLIQSRGG